MNAPKKGPQRNFYVFVSTAGKMATIENVSVAKGYIWSFANPESGNTIEIGVYNWGDKYHKWRAVELTTGLGVAVFKTLDEAQSSFSNNMIDQVASMIGDKATKYIRHCQELIRMKKGSPD